MKKWILVAMSAVALMACEEQQTAQPTENLVRPAKVATAVGSAGSQIREFPGVTEAARRSALAFRVGGQVIELPVRAGQLVKKGQLIARLDDASFRNTMADRKAKYELAKTDYERQQALFNQKHIAESRLDSARSNFKAAEAAYRLSRNDVNYTRLKAPYDGIISRLDIDNFQNVRPQEVVAQYQGAEQIHIVINIPESVFVQLSNEDDPEERNTPAYITFDAAPGKSYTAYYKEHETVPDAATRSFAVTLAMPLPGDLTVLPGMSVTASVDFGQLLGQTEEGVLVPLEAVFDDADKHWVWKLDDGNKTQKTEVAVGSIDGENIRIIQGLDDGERVIAVGVGYIREGQEIRPIVKERGL